MNALNGNFPYLDAMKVHAETDLCCGSNKTNYFVKGDYFAEKHVENLCKFGQVYMFMALISIDGNEAHASVIHYVFYSEDRSNLQTNGRPW